MLLLCNNLSKYYAPLMKTKKLKYLLDLCIIRADIALTLQQPNAAIGMLLTCVGKALEPQGRFEEAASVYQDVVDAYAPTLDERAKQQGNCALAWKRAGKYEVSEEACVKTLYLLSRMSHLSMADFPCNKPCPCATARVSEVLDEIAAPPGGRQS